MSENPMRGGFLSNSEAIGITFDFCEPFVFYLSIISTLLRKKKCSFSKGKTKRWSPASVASTISLVMPRCDKKKYTEADIA